MLVLHTVTGILLDSNWTYPPFYDIAYLMLFPWEILLPMSFHTLLWLPMNVSIPMGLFQISTLPRSLSLKPLSSAKPLYFPFLSCNSSSSFLPFSRYHSPHTSPVRNWKCFSEETCILDSMENILKKHTLPPTHIHIGNTWWLLVQLFPNS